MLDPIVKEYYQSRIKCAIEESKDDKQTLRGKKDQLMLLVEGVNALAKMAETLNNQARDKATDAYIKRCDDIEEVRILLSCILPKAYQDPFYLSSYPDVVIGLLMRGQLMGEYIDQIQALPKAEYDVHFQLNSYMRITAENEEEARNILNDIIEEALPDLEKVLYVGFESDDYTTDVLLATD